MAVLDRVLQFLDWKTSGRLMALSALVGVIAGLGAIAFQWLSHTVVHFSLVSVAVTPDDDLNTALRCFTATAIDELPVVDAADRSRVLGTLRHKETIAAYNRRLAEHKQVTEAENG